jgi:hypothetical protein
MKEGGVGRKEIVANQLYVHFYIKEGKEGLGEKEGDVENEWE